MRLRLLLVLCAAVAVTVGGSTAAAANGDKNECKNGGWQSWYRADGTSFKNQGACIAYVNAGSTLYSAVADVSLSAKVIIGAAKTFEATATNAGPSTVTISGEIAISAPGCGLLHVTVWSYTLAPGETSEPFGLGTVGLCVAISAIDAYAQVTSADVYDPDSTPNNYTGGFTGPAVEDDEVYAHIQDAPTTT